MLSVLITSVLPWLLLAVGSWLGYQLVRQNGRMLLRLETIEKLLAARAVPPRQEPQGLRVGTPAPDFELPDLAGNLHRLSEFFGRELLLVFFNPQCGFCTAMANDLAALSTDSRNGRPVPLVVTTGEIGLNFGCVDLSSDPYNCGACSNQCAPSEACAGGVCQGICVGC